MYITEFVESKTTDAKLADALKKVVVDKLGEYADHNDVIKKNQTLNDLWSEFAKATGTQNHSHALHGGKEITLGQFVKSAIESYETQFAKRSTDT